MTLNREPLSNISKLGDLLDLVIDYRGKTPKKLGGDFSDSGVPVISAIHIKRGKIVWEERERFVTKEMFQKWMKDPLKKGDVLLTSEAPLGEVALVPSDEDLVLSQRLFALRTKPELLDSKYLMYFFQSSFGQEQLRGRSSGSTVIGIRQAELINIDIPCPPIAQQRMIGKVLANIDAKILANEDLSQSLEDIAQTIFKSWFIYFDPVKAKMAGEKPASMDAATAALFPNSMEESEVGLIPSGWELRKVEEILKRITVKGLPKSTVLLNLGRTLVLEQGDSVIAGFIDEDADVKATNDSPAFVFGDHTCRMRLSTIPFSVFPNTIVLTSEHINTYWAFGATWGLQNFETYRRHWMELAYKVLVVPNTEVADVYGEQVKPLFELIDSLMVQNRMLSALRDDLLPRLISGELQIPEEMLAS